jgi:hypothetical protein
MFPAGYADFSYSCRIGRSSSKRTTEVACGTSYIELLLDEGLDARGLELPHGNLTIDNEKGEISIHRSLALPEEGLSVAYSRIYPSQYGFDKMMRLTRRRLKKGHIYQPSETFITLSNLFHDYLVRNLGFTEKVVFSYGTSSESWVQGRTRFVPSSDGAVPEEHAEYSVGLSDRFIEEISELGEENNGRSLSIRRRNILARKEEPLGIDTFLRAVDIYPARSKDENVKSYKNLRKCSAFLMRIIFKEFL